MDADRLALLPGQLRWATARLLDAVDRGDLDRVRTLARGLTVLADRLQPPSPKSLNPTLDNSGP